MTYHLFIYIFAINSVWKIIKYLFLNGDRIDFMIAGISAVLALNIIMIVPLFLIVNIILAIIGAVFFKVWYTPLVYWLSFYSIYTAIRLYLAKSSLSAKRGDRNG